MNLLHILCMQHISIMVQFEKSKSEGSGIFVPTNSSPPIRPPIQFVPDQFVPQHPPIFLKTGTRGFSGSLIPNLNSFFRYLITLSLCYHFITKTMEGVSLVFRFEKLKLPNYILFEIILKGESNDTILSTDNLF